MSENVLIFSEVIPHLEANALTGSQAEVIIFREFVDFIDSSRDFPNLRRLVFEKGLGTIRGGFRDCPCLEELVIRERLESVEGSAFSNCPALMKISLPDGVFPLSEGLMEAPFFRRKDLYEDGFLYLGSMLMATDPALSGSVTVKEGTTGIAAGCFAGRGITSCRIPASVVSIGEYAFARCGLRSVTIPGSVEGLPVGCFSDCRDLEEVVLEEGFHGLGNGCFRGCSSLSSLSLPSTLSRAGLAAPFAGCPLLTDKQSAVTFSNGTFAERMVVRDKHLCPKEYVVTGREAIPPDYFEGALFSSVVISGDVKKISPRAFYDCPNLRKVTICDGVEEIGIGAFSRCRVDEIFVPASVKELCGSTFMNHCKRIVIDGEPVWSADPDRDYWYRVDEIMILSDRMSLKYDPDRFGAFEGLAVPKQVKLTAPEGSVARREWEEFQDKGISE